jgi:hypothetical protein
LRDGLVGRLDGPRQPAGTPSSRDARGSIPHRSKILKPPRPMRTNPSAGQLLPSRTSGKQTLLPSGRAALLECTAELKALQASALPRGCGQTITGRSLDASGRLAPQRSHPHTCQARAGVPEAVGVCRLNSNLGVSCRFEPGRFAATAVKIAVLHASVGPKAAHLLSRSRSLHNRFEDGRTAAQACSGMPQTGAREFKSRGFMAPDIPY